MVTRDGVITRFKSALRKYVITATRIAIRFVVAIGACLACHHFFLSFREPILSVLSFLQPSSLDAYYATRTYKEGFAGVKLQIFSLIPWYLYLKLHLKPANWQQLYRQIAILTLALTVINLPIWLIEIKSPQIILYNTAYNFVYLTVSGYIYCVSPDQIKHRHAIQTQDQELTAASHEKKTN